MAMVQWHFASGHVFAPVHYCYSFLAELKLSSSWCFHQRCCARTARCRSVLENIRVMQRVGPEFCTVDCLLCVCLCHIYCIYFYEEKCAFPICYVCDVVCIRLVREAPTVMLTILHGDLQVISNAGMNFLKIGQDNLSQEPCISTQHVIAHFRIGRVDRFVDVIILLDFLPILSHCRDDLVHDQIHGAIERSN